MAAALGFVACAGGNPAVSPDEMSAQKHRQEAEKEHQVADSHAKQWNPTAAQPSPFRDPIDAQGGTYLYSTPVYNPTDWHLEQADRHRSHARNHEAAARSLEKFEEAECKSFPPATRAACPLLGPAESIQDIDGGVRVRMAPSVRVDAIVAHMKCHQAYARSHGYESASSCGLYLAGLEIRRDADPAGIDMTMADRSRVADLRRHAHEEVIVPASRRP